MGCRSCGKTASLKSFVRTMAPRNPSVKYCDCGGAMRHEKMKVVSGVKIYKYRCFSCKKSTWDN